MNTAEYSLILMTPAVERLDSVVVGAIFCRDGGWDVRVASSIEKMKAINPQFSLGQLTQMGLVVTEFSRGMNDLSALRKRVEGIRLGIHFSEFVGRFAFLDEADYQGQVQAVLRESVNPLAVDSSRNIISRRRNIVTRKLREHFQGRGIWSRAEGDIANHKIVERYTISEDHGVVADFALRNGVMHITETIDFELQNLKARRTEAQAKSFVLTESKRVFGADTKTYAVIAGSANDEVRKSVRLLEDHADVFAIESMSDMERYVEIMSAAAGHPQSRIPLQ